MSDENLNLQRQADRAKPTSRRSALTYLVILFAAAFILLLLAFFMQQRNNELALGQLSSSATAVNSIEQLLRENELLRTKTEELEDQVDALSSLEPEAQRAQALEESLDAILVLECLEYLCQTEQIEFARMLDGQNSRLAQQLDQLDQENQETYAADQPTLSDRYQAIQETLTEEEPA